MYRFCSVLLFEGNFPITSPRGGSYLEGRFNGGFFCVTGFGGPIFGGAYTWRAYFRNFTVIRLNEARGQSTINMSFQNSICIIHAPLAYGRKRADVAIGLYIVEFVWFVFVYFLLLRIYFYFFFANITPCHPTNCRWPCNNIAPGRS